MLHEEAQTTNACEIDNFLHGNLEELMIFLWQLVAGSFIPQPNQTFLSKDHMAVDIPNNQ
ncbi:hypothetical protein Xtri_18690 [Xanthomonas campestris pv. trichodesmae]|uniref:Uncharacterized protein n=2 Tax=Xanthomonas citri TaxID=346 RepID=A0AB33CAA2_XANCI|nr:hypothetical protein XcvCFBP7111P_07025 [Xanthomonas citri pv. vignicola]MBZ3921565.1 hypothetical protein [Xanthomonas campestris pv. trichodesmae]MBZ3925979.1 hypothetical protein [Xanthomonas citri pv. sesbaniae]